MKCEYACGSLEHEMARRDFLGLVSGGCVLGGLSSLLQPAAAAELEKSNKKVLVVFMSGGVSQLETWDPKPRTDTGGPFRAIPTAVPGVHISELLPMTAQQMKHLSLIRSINTKENDHGKGRYAITHGRKQTPGADFPHLGAVTAKALEAQSNGLPGHIRVTSGGGGNRGNDAAYLGPMYASVSVGGKPPANSSLPSKLSAETDLLRNRIRQNVNDRFARRRRTAETDAYTYSYEQGKQLMAQRDVFDVTKEPAKDHERYGKYDLGRHMLLARRLLENGLTYVQVSHSNYDTHNENFNFHLEQLGEFDRSFSNLIADLNDRGLLDDTLVVVMSEFGRTPRINQYYGRDHWGTAWSICLTGAGIQRGAVIGKTNANGTKVIDREVHQGHIFPTFLSAVGIDPSGNFDIGGRPMPLSDPAHEHISEILA